MSSHPGAWFDLLRQGGQAVCIEPDGQVRTGLSSPPALLPGSFNPLHEGHCRLADVASDLLGCRVSFELSLANVDKPPLESQEVERRIRQFAGRAALWLTHAPTFLQKAELFPGTVFVVGADTAERIVSACYYQDSEARMMSALARLRGQGCRFLVASRLSRAGRFIGLEEIDVPPAFADLFCAIPAARFRLDLSSTELRSRQ